MRLLVTGGAGYVGSVVASFVIEALLVSTVGGLLGCLAAVRDRFGLLRALP